MRTYKAIISCDNWHDREYTVTSKSALKAAQQHGRGENGETITITRVNSGTVISRAYWNRETKQYENAN